MDEADSATKALGLDEPPIGLPAVGEVGSDTESEAEVTTMAVMAEPGNIDMEAESMPNPDEAEAAFAGKAGFKLASRPPCCGGAKAPSVVIIMAVSFTPCLTAAP